MRKWNRLERDGSEVRIPGVHHACSQSARHEHFTLRIDVLPKVELRTTEKLERCFSFLKALVNTVVSADDYRPFLKDVRMWYSCDFLEVSIGRNATVTIMCSAHSSSFLQSLKGLSQHCLMIAGHLWKMHVILCAIVACDFLVLSIGHATMTVMCSTISLIFVFAAPTSLELVKAADIQSDPWQHVEKFIKQQQEQQYAMTQCYQASKCSSMHCKHELVETSKHHLICQVHFKNWSVV